jgi:cytochrome c oxidase subunit II
MNTDPREPKPEQAPGAMQPTPSRRSLLSFGLITAGAVGGAGYFLWPMLRQSTLSTPEATIPVAISMSGFSPNLLAARVGQRIDLQLINRDNSLHSDGGGWHQLAIDALGLDFMVAPLSESEVSFTVDSPGTYDFYCGVCCGGRANPYMHGQLVVEA